jgi:hypothetical protein
MKLATDPTTTTIVVIVVVHIVIIGHIFTAILAVIGRDEF